MNSLDSHKSVFVDTFKKPYIYPYKPNQLEFLVKKTSIFLLSYFKEIYKNIGNSYMLQPDQINPPFPKISPPYYLASLNCIVDIKCLPTGYHTSYTPSINICDHCKEAFPNDTDDVIVLICGHGYHLTCYDVLGKVCSYCENYYKKGIDENVKKIKQRQHNYKRYRSW